jgi:ribosomal protein S16
VQYWLSHGAKASDRVASLVKTHAAANVSA